MSTLKHTVAADNEVLITNILYHYLFLSIWGIFSAV